MVNRLSGMGQRFTSGGSRASTGGRRRRGIPRSVIRMVIAALVIIVVLILAAQTASVWVDWWWFGSTGHREILTTRLYASSGLFVVGFVVAALIVGGNMIAALRRSRTAMAVSSDIAIVAGRILLIAVLIVTVIVAFAAGSSVSHNWEQWLFALHGQRFGVKDAAFHLDVGFYFFLLPALMRIVVMLTTLIVLSLIAVIAIYLIRSPQSIRQGQLPGAMRGHVFGLGAVLLLLIAVRYWLNNYLLVYSTRGPVTGMTYTDATIQRFANYALVVVTVIAAALLLVSIRRFQWRPLLILAGTWVAVVVLLGVAIPALVQKTFVEPNQLRREAPYIADNISMTRQSFGIADLQQTDLTGNANPTQADIASNQQTIDNVRLWDYGAETEANQQLQAIERFYVFNDSDPDRYTINGQDQQVLVSARELDTSGLPDNARSWTNLHLAYTHGYGVVLSPVAEATNGGQPVYTLQGFSGLASAPVPVTRPEIYFGENNLDYAIVDTNTTEYTEGSPAQPYAATASGAIRLDNRFVRFMSALALGDRNIAISNEITGQSQLLLHRNITDRVHRVAPFLTLDPDPYVVIANGQLYWVIDAYTTSDRWPGANSVGGMNYIRNSVKITVNAYDGKMTFYRTNTPDPVADAYGKIYNDLFTPIASAPPAIAAHFRYPQMLFEAQSSTLNRYHSTDPREFYDGNDQWSVPPGGATGSGALEPYFVTMALPGQSKVDFTLIRPFIPGGRQTRQNMAAWLGGQSDPQGNNTLSLYRFPRDTPVAGPQQIEASIDQNPAIASELTLLGQGGSTVIRGNLLVIPINQTILYVQPLYLQATNSPGSFPQLAQVIVAGGGGVVMKPTYQEALNALLAGTGAPIQTAPGQTTTQPQTSPTQATPQPVTPAQQELAGQALGHYQAAQDALARGDWATYGSELGQMQAILEQLSGTPVATPIA